LSEMAFHEKAGRSQVDSFLSWLTTLFLKLTDAQTVTRVLPLS
jgi:hypothetical protein